MRDIDRELIASLRSHQGDMTCQAAADRLEGLLHTVKRAYLTLDYTPQTAEALSLIRPELYGVGRF